MLILLDKSHLDSKVLDLVEENRVIMSFHFILLSKYDSN